MFLRSDTLWESRAVSEFEKYEKYAMVVSIERIKRATTTSTRVKADALFCLEINMVYNAC